MISANPSQQRRLVDLQAIDTAIRQLLHRRANLPEQQALDANAETLAQVSSEYATNRERLDRLAAQQKRHEDDIATIDARRKTEEGRLYSGKIVSPKELEALRSEIDGLKARKSDVEDALLEIMEQREDLDGLVAGLAQRQTELSGHVDDLTAARDAAAGDLDSELAEQQRQRAEVIADIPDDVVGYYEELRVRKDGFGVAELRDRACTGCHLELTPIELEEVQADAARRLARCPQCGRILVPAG